MSFLFPAFLAGAAAVAVPILLHLLRRDAAARQPFSDIRLLRRMPAARRRRLRDRLLLVLRVSALLLLALAFARPYLGADGGGSRGVTLRAGIGGSEKGESRAAQRRFKLSRPLATAFSGALMACLHHTSEKSRAIQAQPASSALNIRED